MKKLMRHRLVMVLILFLTMQITACGGSTEAEENEDSGTQAVSESPRESEGNSSLEKGPFSLSWEIRDDRVFFTLSAETTGWVALGIDPERSMLGADFIIGYVSDGEASVADHYGNSRYSHQDDSEGGGTTDIADVSGSESGGTTTISFSIPLSPDDSRDKQLEPGRTYTILLAHGGDGEDNFKSAHTTKTRAEISL
ncbi:MAG: DOMON domain-containing protein [Spirochaetia bacterium]